MPFSGGVRFETTFGNLYSSNITPDPTTGIGAWKADDLRRAMHEGIAAGGYRLFPAFPYTAFTKVSDADVDATRLVWARRSDDGFPVLKERNRVRP